MIVYTMVTGAASGIGRALASECAKNRMNLLLVSLPGDELEETADSIRKEYSVQCHTLGIDLSEADSAKQVYDWTKDHDFHINTLINNVGIGSKGAFDETDTSFYQTQINLNVMTTCMLTRLFLPELRRQKHAYILNVGSMGGFFIMPDKTVYSATKAFVYSFSRSLQMELKGTNIKVCVLCPGGTDSNCNTIAANKSLKGIARMSILTPDEVAKEALHKMLKGNAVIIPGFLNRFLFRLSQIIPEFISNYFVERAFKRLNGQVY